MHNVSREHIKDKFMEVNPMGFFSSLFGKKENKDKAKVTITISEPTIKSTPQDARFHLRGIPDAAGLYPGELVMLSLSENYKTEQTDFPKTLLYSYEIANPSKVLKSLH